MSHTACAAARTLLHDREATHQCYVGYLERWPQWLELEYQMQPSRLQGQLLSMTICMRAMAWFDEKLCQTLLPAMKVIRSVRPVTLHSSHTAHMAERTCIRAAAWFGGRLCQKTATLNKYHNGCAYVGTSARCVWPKCCLAVPSAISRNVAAFMCCAAHTHFKLCSCYQERHAMP